MLRSEIPFSRDDANRFLPWMVALMCAITALMLCIGITLGHWVRGQQGQVSTEFTVQIPPACAKPDCSEFSNAETGLRSGVGKPQGDRQAQDLRQVLAVLEKTPNVGSAHLLSPDEVRALVEPWLGGGDIVRMLPLPVVIQAQTTGEPDYPLLAKQLKAIAPDISVDTQVIWAEKFARLSNALQAFAYGFALCVIMSLAGMMAFTSRVAMKLHTDTVTLLHAIGADDRYIARQFQANALALALRGALPGTIAAGVAYALFAMYSTRLDAPLMPDLTPGPAHLFMPLLLPAACCLVSVFAARFAALAQLRLLP